MTIQATRLGLFSKYKWRLDSPYLHHVEIYGFSGHGSNNYVKITDRGQLLFCKGYCWDGASGPTWDTPSCRRASMVHDGLYQLMREGILPKHYKGMADQILKDLLIEDGMWKWRANLWYFAVDKFGGFHI